MVKLEQNTYYINYLKNIVKHIKIGYTSIE